MTAEQLTAELLTHVPDHDTTLLLFRMGEHPRLAVYTESIKATLREGWEPCGFLFMDRIEWCEAEMWTAHPLPGIDREHERFLNDARDSVIETRMREFGVDILRGLTES